MSARRGSCSEIRIAPHSTGLCARWVHIIRASKANPNRRARKIRPTCQASVCPVSHPAKDTPQAKPSVVTPKPKPMIAIVRMLSGRAIRQNSSALHDNSHCLSSPEPRDVGNCRRNSSVPDSRSIDFGLPELIRTGPRYPRVVLCYDQFVHRHTRVGVKEQTT